ncbi:hypothetical protein, partial [Pseudarthrobacter siccitolerans]
MAPLALIALVLLCFVKEVPLKTTIERDLVPDALSAGQLMTESEGDEPDVIEPVTRANLSGDVWRRKKMQRIEFVQPG